MDDNRSGSGGELSADRAAASLDELVERSAAAAGAIDEAFARAGEAIESALVSAARTGEDAFARMTQSVLRSLADLAVERIVDGPVASLLDSALGSGGFLRPRADGGPVAPGGAYLVGERGPELFVPASAGSIEFPAGGPVSVHFHLGGGADTETLKRSQRQIAAMVARAVAEGRKRL